ncbi:MULTISPECIES: hypothetical protein [unclassified Neochlamydia]|uniref:hypothetical protein n=1 Tax=unclassified Neochlamydia TaxID=2643326 RepID=UPI00140CAD32|nr:MULTISPECIES: hypothetical protein [unclassified Neochlamydia]NGY94448.1 hypothetical protein [Neochlamydia sp. AcF84]
MDFTREPIIETVITPKEGCKIVVRNSKNVGQEEYFVDALEVVSFGTAIFFRSLEKPKSFLVPVNDYEILEVREARMVLKNVGLERSIKIGGGRETKAVKEMPIDKMDPAAMEESNVIAEEQTTATDNRAEKKRDRRRQQRRRRGREEQIKEDIGGTEAISSFEDVGQLDVASSSEGKVTGEGQPLAQPPAPFMSGLLPPPPTLISETIGRYKENILFKNAFYTREEAKEDDEVQILHSLTEDFEGDSEEVEEFFKEEQSELPPIVEPAPEFKPLSSEEQNSSFHSFWDDLAESASSPLPLDETNEIKEPLEEGLSNPEKEKE